MPQELSKKLLRFPSRVVIVSGAVLFLTLTLTLPLVINAATVTPRIELVGNAGGTLTDILKITNEEHQSRTYFTDIQNFSSQDETGNPHFTGGRQDLATWIDIPATITVGPGESKEVQFAVHIPAKAEAGGHFAAIFLQINPPNLSQGGEVGISAKLGSLVLLTVGGNFQQGANVLEFATKNRQYFFTALPIYFYYRFQNTGADHLKPVGDVLIGNTFGRTTKILPANPVDGTVLPKSIRRFETVWFSSFGPLEQGTAPSDIAGAPAGFWKNAGYEWHNFAFGKYTATLKVVFGTKILQSTNASFSFYIIPWQLLLVVILGLIIIFHITRFGIRRYNRYIISSVQSQYKNRK